MTSEAKEYRVQEPKLIHYIFSTPGGAGLWFVIRILLGWQWFDAARHKLSDPAWMSSGVALKGFWERAVSVPSSGRPIISYGWYRDFIQFMLDHEWYTWFAKVVAIGELAVGLALIFGAFTGIAAFFGSTMNFNYMLAGTASTNPLMFALAILLIMAWKVAGYWGLGRWLLPPVGTPWAPGQMLRAARGKVTP